MTGRQLHRTGTTVLSLAMIAIGVALAVEALIGVEGPFSVRLVAGLLFMAGGGGRLYVLVRKARGT